MIGRRWGQGRRQKHREMVVKVEIGHWIAVVARRGLKWVNDGRDRDSISLMREILGWAKADSCLFGFSSLCRWPSHGSSFIIMLTILDTETVSGSGKDTAVRVIWIWNRGLFRPVHRHFVACPRYTRLDLVYCLALTHIVLYCIMALAHAR